MFKRKIGRNLEALELEAKVLLYSVGIWLLLLVLAIVNAGISEAFYKPKLGDNPSHAISSIIAIGYTLIITYFFVDYIKVSVTKIDLLLIGALWLTLTVVFEFGFGHYVIGHSWRYLLADYNILKGRLWSLVLLVTFVSPLFWGYIIGVD